MAELNQSQVQDVTSEILEHLMYPKNYGKMENPSSVGTGVDSSTGEFAMIYLLLENDTIKDIKHMCNACQDTVVAGSLFTEMIKGETTQYAKTAANKIALQIKDAPKKQQACTGMVLKAFEASLQHYENKKNGSTEEMLSLEVNESCEIEEEE